ncbi:MAG: nucleotide exchange factor GrpE [Oscillospiraceae bacterium]|nr:nucleotide exchange factor GrpE [Oscillospiraceae bacterium]
MDKDQVKTDEIPADNAETAAEEVTAEDTQPAADTEQTEETGTAEAEQTETEEAEQPDELEELKKQLADEKERYLRLDAEYYNYRTRSVKEKSEAYDNATAQAVSEILTVVDNFERALGTECSDEKFKSGIEMIFRQYLTILEKLGVKEIEALGQPFDPNLHNAVTSIEDEEKGENEVAAVLQKGYTLGKRVIRPAMVTVANP